MYFSKFIITIMALFLIGCATASHKVVRVENINAYKSVTVTSADYDPDGVKYRLERKLTEIGFTIVNEKDTVNLGPADLLRHLHCGWEVHSDDVEVKFRVEMISSYPQQKVIYESESIYYIEWTIHENLIGAIDQALIGLRENYTGFDPSLVNIDIYFTSEMKNETKEDLIKYYHHNNKLDPIEGIWKEITNNNYEIGIFRDDENESRDFVAIITKSNVEEWRNHQVKLELNKTSYSNIYTGTFYIRDHTKQDVTCFINDKGLIEFDLKRYSGETAKARFLKMSPGFVKKAPSKNKKVASGTGFLLNRKGIIATNYHVVENAENINVSFPVFNKNYNASILLKDVNNDIAILELAKFNIKDLSIQSLPYNIVTSKGTQIGEEVFTLGYPLKGILSSGPKLSTGNINSLKGLEDDPRLFQINNPIQPGNSGGPLINENGDIIGILVSTLNSKFFLEQTDVIPQNVNFSIKSDYLLNLINMLPSNKGLDNNKNQLMDKNLQVRVVHITPCVASIDAYQAD